MNTKDVALGVVSTLLFISILLSAGLYTDTLPDDRDTVEIVDTKNVDNNTAPVESVVTIAVNNSSQTGTGFVYDEEYILTNEHVIEGYETARIGYYNSEVTNATVVGKDEHTDIAVLRPGKRPEYAEPLKISSETPELTTPVYTVGNPYGTLNWSVTTGIVSGTDRQSSVDQRYGIIPDMIQTDATVVSGSSGSPLVTQDEGTVVGMVRETRGEGYGVAISTPVINKVSQSIIENGQHNHSFIGVRLRPEDGGLLITDVINNSSADGVLEENTTIVKVDGKRVRDIEELSAYLLLQTNPNDTISVTLKNNSTRKNLTLGSRQ